MYRYWGFNITLLTKNGKPVPSCDSIDLPDDDQLMATYHAGELNIDTSEKNDFVGMPRSTFIKCYEKKITDYSYFEEGAIELQSRILSTPFVQTWDGIHHSSVMYVSSGKVMIILGDSNVERLAVEISILMGGQDTVIGIFRPKDGCRYVTITDLVPGPDYSYSIIDESDTSGSVKDRIKFKLE